MALHNDSPKAKRAKAPGEVPAPDPTPDPTVKGGLQTSSPRPSGSGIPQVPAGLHSGASGAPGRHQGNTDAESAVPVHSPAPSQGGGPGFAKDKGDGMRKGGTKEVS